ncbi:hypothetical protein [Candidatus Leptofilum sp.]|uniref:hypothetical protein n=1 Tax=Candidatus Leptofilum sp. TaxID=3241576 RepID=UPI003B5A051B
MSFKHLFLRLVFIPVLLILVSCGGTDLPPTVSSQDVTVVGLADRTPNNIDIRIDWVEIGENIGDLVGQGELTLELLVIRENGDSRVLEAPGLREYKIDGNNRIFLEGFSLTVNDVAPDEKILVYLIAFENDELSFFAGRGASLALEGAAEALEHAIEKGLIAGKAITNTTLLGIILNTVTGGALEWWQQAEIIGGYGVLLEPENNWQANLTIEGESDDGNLLLQYSILPQYTPQQNEEAADGDEGVPDEETSNAEEPKNTPEPTRRTITATATPRVLPTATSIPPISRLILVNADTNQDIFTLSNNSQINLSSLSTRNLDIRAEVSASADWIQSVIFYLDGRQFEMNGRDAENAPPYAMAGDINGDHYNNWNWENMVGTHTISAKACSEQYGAGFCSQQLTISISVSN